MAKDYIKTATTLGGGKAQRKSEKKKDKKARKDAAAAKAHADAEALAAEIVSESAFLMIGPPKNKRDRAPDDLDNDHALKARKQNSGHCSVSSTPSTTPAHSPPPDSLSKQTRILLRTLRNADNLNFKFYIFRLDNDTEAYAQQFNTRSLQEQKHDPAMF